MQLNFLFRLSITIDSIMQTTWHAILKSASYFFTPPHRPRSGVPQPQVGAGPASRLPSHRLLPGWWALTVRAYQRVQGIRRRLREAGITDSWSRLRQTLSGPCRVTATFRRADGRTLHVRKATRAEPGQLALYRALGLDPAPGGVKKIRTYALADAVESASQKRCPTMGNAGSWYEKSAVLRQPVARCRCRWGIG